MKFNIILCIILTILGYPNKISYTQKICWNPNIAIDLVDIKKPPKMSRKDMTTGAYQKQRRIVQ